MDRLSTLQLFVRIVECGSLSQAARELGVGQPSVSKQVAALEARLGTSLLNRTSRSLHPTAAGQELYEAAVQLLGDFDAAESRIGSGSISPSGLVRVSIPPALGPRYIVPRLPDFLAEFPDIDVELNVSEQHVDLVKEGIDVALRVGHLDDSALVARRVGALWTVTVATPDYLVRHGTPSDPSQLDVHNLVTIRLRGAPSRWAFKGVDGAAIFYEGNGRLRLNDADTVRAAVLAGLGIGHDTTALFAADLDAGRVTRILADFAPDPVPIQVVYANGRNAPRRLRVFADFLAKVCAAEPSLRLP
ncbi:MAG: LysR family transcriptional regulator [Zymomonas sp.]|nr:MAG: LysR family transcriptional regulator [Zymomonas sp.]